MPRSESYNNDNETNYENPNFEDRPRNFMNISDSIAQRLQTGAVDDERLKNHDQNWIDKLSEMDRNHTIEKNLNASEAHRILQSLSSYSSGGVVTTCPVDKRKMIDCYAMTKGDTLKCEPEVKEFVTCIDKLLYKALHINGSEGGRAGISLMCPRKMTYRERFERTCINK